MQGREKEGIDEERSEIRSSSCPGQIPQLAHSSWEDGGRRDSEMGI